MLRGSCRPPDDAKSMVAPLAASAAPGGTFIGTADIVPKVDCCRKRAHWWPSPVGCIILSGPVRSVVYLACARQHNALNLLMLQARKPYTISKQRERWTDSEHAAFLEALQTYGRAWRKIEEHIGSKSAVQIRSHAQKYFSKLDKEKAKGLLPGMTCCCHAQASSDTLQSSSNVPNLLHRLATQAWSSSSSLLRTV